MLIGFNDTSFAFRVRPVETDSFCGAFPVFRASGQAFSGFPSKKQMSVFANCTGASGSPSVWTVRADLEQKFWPKKSVRG